MPTAALGILEVRGMVALAAAVDVMFKATSVRLVGRHMIGSGWLTVVIEGQTADVQVAIDNGRQEAALRGDVITAAVVPRPEADALGSMPHGASLQAGGANGEYEALGILETKGVVPLVAAADAMVKAGDVDLAGWTFIGGALVHACVTGSVGDVEAAIAAGELAAQRAGEFHAALVLSQPEMELDLLLPPRPAGERRATGGLGIVETTGYVGSVAASDVMVKDADVAVVGLTIGSGGRVATLVEGRLDDVTAAVDSGSARAGEAAELNGQIVIPRPDEAVMAAFAHPVASTPPRSHADTAMGLVETRTTIGLVMALDAMLKNADVTYEGRYKVGYFLTACVVRGETGAVEMALDVARSTAGQYGELVAAHIIPLPYDTMEKRLPHA
jgi:carbon dioxide concentrating mechanism protein CcmO